MLVLLITAFIQEAKRKIQTTTEDVLLAIRLHLHWNNPHHLPYVIKDAMAICESE